LMIFFISFVLHWKSFTHIEKSLLSVKGCAFGSTYMFSS
jgi:hypothetical protein